MKTDEIQDEIERTRGEMASTLNAIERKLSPRQLMDQAVDTMREIASDQSRVGSIVRENPIPLAIIGLGMAWLAVTGMRRTGGSEEAYYEGAEGPSASSAWGSEGLESGRGYGVSAAGVGTAGYGAESYSGNGQRVREKAGEIAGQARERLESATERTRQTVSDWSRSVRVQASQAADRTWEAYQDHPLTMGMLALGVGAVIGALVPRSRTEEQVIGGAAGDMMRQAREAGSELMDKASAVASRTIDKAREEGAEAIREVTGTAKEETQRQTSGGSTMTH
ncbi:MAG: DUF3618 domain-containing protein [Solirubrobacterales bacterium]